MNQFIANISANADTLHFYQAMTTYHASLKPVVLRNEQRFVNPIPYEVASQRLKELNDNLVLVLNLPLLFLDLLRQTNPYIVRNSFDEYSKEIEKGKKLWIDGNADEIKRVIQDIGGSKANIKLVYIYESITMTIQKTSYTEASYNRLFQEIERVETLAIKNSTKGESKAIDDSIQLNLNCLVSM